MKRIPLTRFAFIDRDGTLLREKKDTQDVGDVDEIRFVPGAICALNRIAAAGYTLVMVTNQDDLGTPSNPQKTFERVNRILLDALASAGVEFAEVLVDKTTADAPGPGRKPGTAMVDKLLATTPMDAANSFVVGDRQTDLDFAVNLGVRGFRLSAEWTWEAVAHEVCTAPRRASVQRETKETRISCDFCADGTGKASVQTGLGFLDHLLESYAMHGGFDLHLRCAGDAKQTGSHHTVEDVAIVLGSALANSMGNFAGIQRFGNASVVVMDEVRAEVAVDISGRPHVEVQLPKNIEPDPELPPASMLEHFFRSFAHAAGLTVHLRVSGKNAHHLWEASIKSLARSLRGAVARMENGSGAVPSTKGTLCA